jgi:hypothetical protein
MKRSTKEHKTELRKKELSFSYCVQPGCKFRGKRAQQGICHTIKTHAGGDDWSYIDMAERHATEAMEEIKRLFKGKKYVRALEAYYQNSLVNDACILDMLVRLRRENALLKLKVKKR